MAGYAAQWPLVGPAVGFPLSKIYPAMTSSFKGLDASSDWNGRGAWII